MALSLYRIFAQKKERAEALPNFHFWFLNADFCRFSANIAHLLLFLVDIISDALRLLLQRLDKLFQESRHRDSCIADILENR